MTAHELVAGDGEFAAADGRRLGGALGRLWSRISLKPYGDSLCTPGAAFWIFCARIAILVMAAAEAISWAYLGYYIGQSSVPYVTAVLAGLAVFSVVWIIDASFITLDTSRSRDEAAIYGASPAGRSDRLRLLAGLIIRGAIISATLLISAPFLAQLVFFRDISAEMTRRDAAQVAQRRAQLAASFDTRAAELLRDRKLLDEASIAEAAGAGPSRRMGRGPAVATIEKRLADMDRDRATLQTEKDDALRAFDALGRGELQRRYGLRFVDDGIRTRADILTALRANESYGNAELAIRGFLAFLFLALVVLKLFQPSSVGVYFSELLQDLHAQYRAGSFDEWLPPQERSYARSGLTPLRFRAWAAGNYRGLRGEEERQRRMARTMAGRSSREAELRALLTRTDSESEPLRREAAAAGEALSEMESSMAAIHGGIQASREQLEAQERALESVGATLRGGVAGEAFVRAAEAHAALERDTASLRAALRAQEAERDLLLRRREQQQTLLTDLRTRLVSRQQARSMIDGELARLTTETAAALSAKEHGP